MRHGETVWTISGQYSGRTYILLTERGERDALEILCYEAGALCAPAAGLELHAPLGSAVEKGQPPFYRARGG
jgi:broad specificity phosphatase PhoE